MMDPANKEVYSPPPYLNLGCPDQQKMKDNTPKMVQVGSHAFYTENITDLNESCCFFCCGCLSTLHVEKTDPNTNKKSTKNYTFWCNDSAAANAITKIREYMGGKRLL
jgi:hypothetical protein